METLNLQKIFGINATQTVDELIIKKSDLSMIGLTATTNNRAEQLLVAILLKALSNFQGFLIDEEGNLMSDENNKLLGYDNKGVYEYLEMFLWNEYPTKRTDSVFLTKTIVMHSYAETD
jgi:hypothetical protein